MVGGSRRRDVRVELAATYAPKLTLLGTVGSATPSGVSISGTIAATISTPAWWAAMLYVVGANATYGEKVLPLSQVLTPTGITVAAQIKKLCVGEVIGTLAPKYSGSQLFLSTTVPPAWDALASQGDPGTFKTAGSAPVLIIQGADDTLVMPDTSAALADHLCAL